MKSPEEKILDAITDSAKRKFDYPSFEKICPSADIADMILFKVIIGFAEKSTGNKIALNLFNYLLAMGYKSDKEEWIKFIEEKEGLFGIEILALQIANDMRDSGSDPIAIYSAISQLLK